MIDDEIRKILMDGMRLIDRYKSQDPNIQIWINTVKVKLIQDSNQIAETRNVQAVNP